MGSDPITFFIGVMSVEQFTEVFKKLLRIRKFKFGAINSKYMEAIPGFPFWDVLVEEVHRKVK